MLHDNHSNCNPEFVQAACKKFESEISELKNRLKTQETETRKANAKFEFSVAAQEKLQKKNLKQKEKLGPTRRLPSSAGPNKRRLPLLKEPPNSPA